MIPSELPETGLHQALREIEEVMSGPGESIMVLGRYRGSRSALGRHGRGTRNLHFNTVHSTKGQEADYVIVLDLKDGRYGFPCKVEDDPLLTIVMPPNHGDPYPFAEERRLFYVALTRARKAVFLITDPTLSSKRILFQHTLPLPKRGGKEPKAASRANNNTDRKRHSVGKAKEEKLTCEPVQPDRSDRTPGPVQQTSQPLPESSTETISFTSRQDYERHREQRPERRALHRRTQQEKRQKAKALGMCRNCNNKAILDQTRCDTCAERHRVSRRRNDADRRAKKRPDQDLNK